MVLCVAALSPTELQLDHQLVVRNKTTVFVGDIGDQSYRVAPSECTTNIKHIKKKKKVGMWPVLLHDRRNWRERRAGGMQWQNQRAENVWGGFRILGHQSFLKNVWWALFFKNESFFKNVILFKNAGENVWGNSAFLGTSLFFYCRSRTVPGLTTPVALTYPKLLLPRSARRTSQPTSLSRCLLALLVFFHTSCASSMALPCHKYMACNV